MPEIALNPPPFNRVRGGGLGGCAGPRLQDSDDGRHRRRRAMK